MRRCCAGSSSPLSFAAAATSAAVAAARPRLLHWPRASPAPCRCHVAPSHSAAVAVDLTLGRTVFARRFAGARPASNQLAVAYAALSLLGRLPDRDRGLRRGRPRGPDLEGDLVLKGFGDPTLDRGDLRELAYQVRAAGIRRVSGRIEADESWLDSRRTGPAWKSWYYLNESPPLSALTVDRGRFRGWITGDPALAAGGSSGSRRSVGISVAGAAKLGVADPVAEQLAITESEPLSRIVRFMNRESDNFTAELLLKQLGAVDDAAGTSAAGAAALCVACFAMRRSRSPACGSSTGPGLSPRNRLTAAALIGCSLRRGTTR